MEKAEMNLIKLMETLEARIKANDYGMDPREHEIIMDFTENPLVEIGFNEERVDSIYFSISRNGNQDSVEFHRILNDNRFKILGLLERVLSNIFSENTNDDACSYDYKYDTDHLGDEVILEVTVIDYFS